MTYDDSISWLFSTRKFGIKLGLDNIRRLLSELGDPHLAVPCFHVAGTNGKGSVCAMLDSCLREAGLRCGLYTSPHLVDFTERIRVGGRPIPREEVVTGLRRLREIPCDPSPTFFEYATALAFDWFARSACEVAVIETGMGGRLDATNVVEPLVSIITPISWDHSDWLGDTLAKIASEKAGIIKPHIPVISAPQAPEAAAVLDATAADNAAPLSVVTHPYTGEMSLRGPHQRLNAAVAISALTASGMAIPPGAIACGLSNTHWPGRFQEVGHRFILDGAHNAHAASLLVATWQEEFGTTRVPVIFGCLSDKDPRSLLGILEPITSEFHFVPVPSPDRRVSPQDLAPLTSLPHTAHGSLHQALEATSTAARVLITGSLFLIGEALATLE